MQVTQWSKGLSVEVGGHGVVSHVGAALLRLLADRSGLTQALSVALSRRGFVPGRDRGRVLVDLAVMIADGGEAIADIEVLRHQSEVFGQVASPATCWRALDEISDVGLRRIARTRAKVRARVWGLIESVPSARAAGRDLGEGVVVLDVDSTIVLAHSDKDGAAATYKHTYGFHPILVTCDNTGELLTIKLRPGNAGANTAADHLTVLTEAVAQVPAAHRRHLLIRGDSAAATHAVLDWLTAQDAKRDRRVEYSIGWSIGEAERAAIRALPAAAWSPALAADGGIRDGAQVAELTGLLALAGWPPGMRVIVRRERPHPGAQLSLFEERDGWRYTAFVTNTTAGALQWLEARHRAHARVEDRIRCAKDTGLRRLPSREFAINTAWCQIAAMACDLIAWLQLLTLDGDLAKAEPKRLRYRLLHTAARLVRGQRRRRLRIPPTWPWANQITAAFTRIAVIPAPG
ncbi:IS1380 family transposase [Micromonospora halophytica]|uniref:Transposase DDE domain-containing protein n=1 Tax=Micromonospora halophytica TaxID=47864 RepID=A0A1C5IIW0_9ACTN|nr:IS1380 family transposase [Micromonospora halophytica]SCG58023.1 Transposase DDE domain-containing protein [Micromonospora halophytica]